MDAERLYARTLTTESGCWEWQGYRTRKGYGHVSVNRKSRRAHRVSWEFTHGPIPDGFMVCHSCDNPPCINPSHLFLGTGVDNIQDCIAKGRYRKYQLEKTHCAKGHEYTPENTRIAKTPSGTARTCKTCDAESSRRYWHSEKAKRRRHANVR